MKRIEFRCSIIEKCNDRDKILDTGYIPFDFDNSLPYDKIKGIIYDVISKEFDIAAKKTN